MTTSVITRTGRNVAFSDERIEELRAQFRGRVMQPGEDGYDDARAVHNAIFDRRPGLIIECSGTADVIDAVDLAREENLLLAVRGGGHSIAGHSVCDGGLLLDLSRMNAVWVDPASRTVTAQGGATWGDADREAQAFGLAVPGGVISTTGVGGLTLGGGLGWLHRAHGLACDHLRSAQVVTANGRLVRASTDEEPDLFWALRGGGGNFGVVTTFEFDAVPLGPMIYAAAPVYPMAAAEDVLRQWVAWSHAVGDEVTSRVLFWSFPDVEALPEPLRGADAVIVAALYAGPADEGERVLAPVRELAEPLADLSAAQPYSVAQANFDPFFAKGVMRSYWKSIYLDDIDEDGIRLIVDRAQNRPHPYTLVHLPMMGGATSRVAADATAFGDRSGKYMLSVDGNWAEPTDDKRGIAWTRAFVDDVSKLPTARGIYLNFSGDGDIGDDLRTSAFGENLVRLGEVKARFDPTNLFSLNNNVRPAGSVELPGQRVTVQASEKADR